MNKQIDRVLSRYVSWPETLKRLKNLGFTVEEGRRAGRLAHLEKDGKEYTLFDAPHNLFWYIGAE